jgi:fucose 4-O-acetylase-like acetyltransferase
VGYVLFYPIVDWVIVNWKRLALVMFLFTTFTVLYMEYIHIQLPFYAHLAPLSATFLLFGAYLGRIKFAEILDKAYKTPRCIIIILALLALSLIMVGFFPTEMSIIYSKFGHYGGYSAYPFVIMSISSGIVLLYGTTIVAKIPYVSEGMAYFGRGSVWIFLLHMFVAKLLVAPFMKLTTDSWLPTMSVTLALILSALTITFSFATVRICSKVSRIAGISFA